MEANGSLWPAPFNCYYEGHLLQGVSVIIADLEIPIAFWNKFESFHLPYLIASNLLKLEYPKISHK